MTSAGRALLGLPSTCCQRVTEGHASPLNTKKALVSAALQFEPPKGSALALLKQEVAQAAHRDQSYYHEKK